MKENTMIWISVYHKINFLLSWYVVSLDDIFCDSTLFLSPNFPSLGMFLYCTLLRGHLLFLMFTYP